VLPLIARVLPGLETKHAYGRVLEMLAPYGAISRYRCRVGPTSASYVNSTPN